MRRGKYFATYVHVMLNRAEREAYGKQANIPAPFDTEAMAAPLKAIRLSHSIILGRNIDNKHWALTLACCIIVFVSSFSNASSWPFVGRIFLYFLLSLYRF